MTKVVHPKTWWFKLAEFVVPDRVREIPEAKSTQGDDPMPILLRQVAIVKNHIYLQQFASGEDVNYAHSHPWTYGTLAIGLWGKLVESQPFNPKPFKWWHAPYFRFMGPNFIHTTLGASKGHTSIFIGLGPKTDAKSYMRYDSVIHWREHIKKIVKRL